MSATTPEEEAARLNSEPDDATAPDQEPEADKWWLSGRRARRAYLHTHAWVYPGRQAPEQPNRSRCQRLTAQQRRADRKLRAHEARKAKRRERRQAAAEVAA